MKHVYDLRCPFCGTGHAPSYFQYGAPDFYKPFDIPYVCSKCNHGMRPQHTDSIVPGEGQTVRTYTMGISLVPIYALWVMWSPALKNRSLMKMGKVGVAGSCKIFESPDADWQLVQADQDIMSTAIRESQPYFNNGGIANMVIYNDDNQRNQLMQQLQGTAGVPVEYIPNQDEAARFLIVLCELMQAFCDQSKTNTLVDTEGGGWMHTLTTARVVDYMMRSPYFLAAMENFANRYFQHFNWRPLTASANNNTVLLFNAKFYEDVEPEWIPLYNGDFKRMSFETLRMFLTMPLTPENHIEHAEEHSPDREVMYANGTRPGAPLVTPPVPSEEEMDTLATVKPNKKPTLH